MTQKETWFLLLEQDGRVGIGECGLFRGLSADDVPDYEQRLKEVCCTLEAENGPYDANLADFPSIQFGLEQANYSLAAPDPYVLFPSDFTSGNQAIPINGLVWMGSEKFMLSQVREKIEAGFRCIKLKIGALDFNMELDLLRSIRMEHPPTEIELRVDANGAFSRADAMEKLKRLSEYGLHSIEQPIPAGQWEAMAGLCATTPIPIALDEELIGVNSVTEKRTLLQTIEPQYLILKPSLLGGYVACDEWIHLAEERGAGWWVTSALESNIGLNAIAQWTFIKQPALAQGLGTGSLFTNNFQSPLQTGEGCLTYAPGRGWEDTIFEKLCI
jgi:o-succinylbenzoate synthase